MPFGMLQRRVDVVTVAGRIHQHHQHHRGAPKCIERNEAPWRGRISHKLLMVPHKHLLNFVTLAVDHHFRELIDVVGLAEYDFGVVLRLLARFKMIHQDHC